MKAGKRFGSTVFLVLANLLEGIFVLSLLIDRRLLIPAFLWHGLASLLVFLGMRLREFKRQEVILPEFASIKDEHRIPTSSHTGAQTGSQNQNETPFAADINQEVANGSMESTDREIPDDVWCRMALPIGFFLPILGIFGLTILVLLIKPDEESDFSMFAEYRDFIRFKQTQEIRFAEIDVMTAAVEKLDVEPVIDLLSGRDKRLVWGSIEVLSKMSEEKAVQMIRKTMGRPDMDIKFYSAWGLDRIESRFNSTRQELEKRLEQNLNVEDLSTLLRLTKKFLESRLMEGGLLVKAAENALKWSKLGRNRFPDLPSFVAFHACFAMFSGNTAEALHIFQELLSQKQLSPEFIPDCAELLFRIGEFDRITELLSDFTADSHNERFLDGQSVETTLEDLRELWLPANGMIT
jgi:hypothetical protein